MLIWKLCNLMGNTLVGGVLEDRQPGGFVEIVQHDLGRATVPLHAEDPARFLAEPLSTVLKVSMDDYPLFTGLVMKPRFDSEQDVVEVNAVSHGAARLQNLVIGARADGAAIPNSVTGNPWRIEATTPSAMLYYLMQYFQPTATELAAGVIPTGIYIELIALGPSINRDFPPGTVGWSILQDLTTTDDPIEWELAAVDGTSGYLSDLRMFYPRQGVDLSETVEFHCEWGRNNAIKMTYEPDGGQVVNRSVQVGQAIEGEPQKFARGDQPESQLAYGQYMQYEGRTDVKESSILAQYAQGAVSTLGWYQDFFTVVIPTDDGSGFKRDAITGAWTKLPRSFGKPYRFGPGPNHDFWIGDTIGAIDKKNINAALTGRVHSGRITEVDNAGNLQTEIQATPTISEVGVTVNTESD